MGTRYLYNTSGNYVAFVSSDNVFDPDSNWLGRIVNGNEIYDPQGEFLGYILDDDRVAIHTLEHKPRRTRPIRPFKPFKPFKPFTRLRMISLPYPYRDVFETQSTETQYGRRSDSVSSEFDRLLDSTLVASDGTILGVVNKNRFDPDSLSNEFGKYGSQFQPTSIFNQYGKYGSQYNPLSPFNQYSTSAPRFKKNGKELGILTSNTMTRNRIDPDKFLTWLKG